MCLSWTHRGEEECSCDDEIVEKVVGRKSTRRKSGQEGRKPDEWEVDWGFADKLKIGTTWRNNEGIQQERPGKRCDNVKMSNKTMNTDIRKSVWLNGTVSS
jgi:hypothetical protein